MKVLNKNTLVYRRDCVCGARLEFDDSDIQHGGDSFRHEYEDYVVCPECGRRIVIKSGSHHANPYE